MVLMFHLSADVRQRSVASVSDPVIAALSCNTCPSHVPTRARRVHLLQRPEQYPIPTTDRWLSGETIEA